MLLRLRCIRCGDWAEMDPCARWDAGLCERCTLEGSAILSWETARHFARWLDRWQKNQDRHPTFLALTAALEALESAPHGRLVTEEA